MVKLFNTFFLCFGFLFVTNCNEKKVNEDDTTLSPIPDLVKEESSLESTFFATVYIEQKSSYDPPSDGDLWPSAWSNDDFLYSVNGDGKGFDLNAEWADIVFNKITGTPEEENIRGERIASGDQLGKVWGDPAFFNRKPTGLISLDGTLYMAVQDLVKEGSNIFNETPSATILKSDDKGETWKWYGEKPMFSNHNFTTIFFLDYGKDGTNNTFDEYVYAYGMDNNWRDSFSDVVSDPTGLYLARIPKEGLQDKSKWQFYTGNLEGEVSWSAPGNIDERQPVLVDKERRYPNFNNLSVISQGSVVYNKAIDRYIYSSWTEFTFEFYEAPTPWGPWKLFLSKDFGPYPWNNENFGGYATTIPSKFITNEGKKMWVLSSTFAGDVDYYNMSYRKLWVSLYNENELPENEKNNQNLASFQNFTQVAPIAAGGVEGGDLSIINDEKSDKEISSKRAGNRVNDYWGYTFAKPLNFNQVVCNTGDITSNGGWFKNLRVQVRQNFEWKNVEDLKIEPLYSLDSGVEPHTAYTFKFDHAYGDGIRIIGRPGGAKNYTSISELEIYYK